MRIFFKYPLTETPTMLPVGARLLHVDVQYVTSQGDTWMLWAEIPDPDAPIEARDVRVFGTGWEIDPAGKLDVTYINTFMHGMFVWHAYEVTLAGT